MVTKRQRNTSRFFRPEREAKNNLLGKREEWKERERGTAAATAEATAEGKKEAEAYIADNVTQIQGSGQAMDASSSSSSSS